MPETTPAPDPTRLTPSEELRLLSQITSRVERLSKPSKIWLRDWLDAEIRSESLP